MKSKKLFTSFLVSLVTLMLCLVSFAGTTLAWFTDTVSNTGNKIQAGTLDIELYQKQGDEYVNISDSTTPVYNYDKWEPGYSTPNAFEIRNNGNLALKYKLSFNLVDSKTGLEQLNADYPEEAAKPVDQQNQDYKDKLAHLTKCGANSKLEDVLVVYKGSEVADIKDENKIGTLSEFLAGTKTLSEGHLLAKETTDSEHPELSDTANMGFIVKMPETAGNEYENASITFDINLVATQWTYEKDGFNSDQYDAQAQFPAVASSDLITEPLPSGKSLEIKKTGAIKSASVPSGAVNPIFNEMKSSEEGASNSLTMTLNVVKQGESQEAITGGTKTTLDLDISMSAKMVTTVGDTSTSNTKDVKSMDDWSTINIDIGTDLENVVVTHNGNAMVNATDTTLDQGQGIYSYNSADGVITVKTKTFSPFAVTYVEKAYVAKVVQTGAKYDTLQGAIDAASAGNTVELLCDYTMPGGSPIQIEKALILDLGEHEFNGGSYGYPIWITGTGVTIKNGTIIANGTQINGAGAITVDGGTVNDVNSVTVYSNGRGILVQNSGTVQDLNCNIYANRGGSWQSNGGEAICINSGTVQKISSGSYKSHPITYYASNMASASPVIYVNSGATLGTINGGDFQGCATLVQSYSSFNITGGTFMYPYIDANGWGKTSSNPSKSFSNTRPTITGGKFFVYSNSTNGVLSSNADVMFTGLNKDTYKLVQGEEVKEFATDTMKYYYWNVVAK